MSVASNSYRFCCSFEGELLVELMLRYWEHPFCEDREFRNLLLEAAAEVLRASMGGECLLDGIPPHQVNFVAAVYYAESASTQSPSVRVSTEQLEARLLWLKKVRRALPSCFCGQDDLIA
jgi:hypothetical protein